MGVSGNLRGAYHLSGKLRSLSGITWIVNAPITSIGLGALGRVNHQVLERRRIGLEADA